MIRDAIRECIADPREFAASLVVLLLLFAAILSVLFALAPMPVKP